jgi:DNA-binding NtrC family response regulator
MNNLKILMAESSISLPENLKLQLSDNGFELIETSGTTDVLKSLDACKPCLVIVVVSEKNNNEELNIAKKIRQNYWKIPLILIAQRSSEAQIINAFREGINDYLTLPLCYKDLKASIQRNLPDHLSLIPEENVDILMVGKSALLKGIKSYLMKAASTDSTVLITGETGTGKELAAHLIYRNSLRHDKPFICINCSALPEGLLESELFGYEKGSFTGACSSYAGKWKLADGGTIFLDEIGDMPSFAQAKILRVIENKEFYRIGGKDSISLDVRIIAATNQNLEELVKEDKFREDLFYRLNIVCINLPPLRERKEDIPLLICYFIKELNSRFKILVEGIEDEVLDTLLRYNWPGNIRELKNFLEATYINRPSRKISFKDIPQSFHKRLKGAIVDNERDRMISVLSATKWNKTKAAEKLDWSRMKLYRKMKKYHITKSSILNK